MNKENIISVKIQTRLGRCFKSKKDKKYFGVGRV